MPQHPPIYEPIITPAQTIAKPPLHYSRWRSLPERESSDRSRKVSVKRIAFKSWSEECD